MSTDTPQPGPGQRTAQDLVKEIAKERGYLGEEQLARIGEINPELRREVEEALLRKDEMIGSAVLTLARNLYTSNARFVFELLQNADDNNYSTALSSGQDPYVSFEVRPGKVSIECNENGFTHENLKAICAIGKSSKVGAAGYIGEKGIGFKSVFMAAWKVHIQSNDFSFSFTHRKGDSGLGMVTPVWEDADESLGGSSTRITLFLHTSDDPEEDARQRETIRLQFQDLQHTILLFLRKLRKVQVSFFDEDDTQTSSTTTFEGVEERQYHVTKHVAENIPKSENRTYSEEQDRADSSTEVVLAFPLADLGTPIVENQDVFAFLPMRPMGFKFLIHTDFVTEASRQGIVTTSLRNRGLLNGIADCFIKAIEEFCQHPTLQYQWMRWLPQRNSYPWDSFWSGLLDRINRAYRKSKFFARSALENWTTYTSCEIYLAKEYTRDDLKLLETYGLESMSPSDAITRVEKDLERDIKDSRMKSPATDNEWHSLAARALILLKNTATVGPAQDRLKQLRFIPLENGTWVSSSSGPLYYSHSSGSLAIPDDLDLSLIDSEAASNPDRRALFDKFGVIEALVKDVRALILKKPINPVADAGALAVSIAHLKFLYLSEVLLEENEDQAKLRGYHVYDQNMRARSPTKHDVYLTTDDAYGPSQLFRPQGDAPGFAAPFLHHNYVQEKPGTPAGYSWGWDEWLQLRLRLRLQLRLTKKGPDRKLELSAAFLYIEQHRPKCLLGALQRVWDVERTKIMESTDIMRELRQVEVVCKGRDEFALSEPLSTTYLPLPELEGKHSRYAEDEGFVFLDLGEPITSSTYRSKWGFLVDDLGVGCTDDLQFYLAILRTIRYSNAAAGVRRNTRVLDLYEVIHARCREADSFLDAQAEARQAINDGNLIYIPAHDSSPAMWTSSDRCLWNAREDMQTAYPLAHLYRTVFHRSEEDLDVLRQFFKTALGVKDSSWEDYLNEMRRLKDLKSEDFDWINDLYSSLDSERFGMMEVDTTKLRKTFAEEPLIYFNIGNVSRWYTVGECLWSSATQIRGRVALNDLYPDLEDFFVSFLGVQELTLDMAYDELKEMGSRVPPPSVAAVKETIWALNSLLDTTADPPDEEPIFRGTVFPVRYPNKSVKLQSGRTQFAIADRKALGDIFAPQAKMLDFTLDEVRRLRPFLSWLDLESRYLSTSVREISTVAGGLMDKLQYRDREFRQKADGLFRIAVHFNSPRTSEDSSELYWTLMGAEVYETDGISSELHLSQDGHGLVHVQDRSELHIREDDSSLKIYVPRDPKTQGFCYFSTLPRRFLEWMMTDPITLQVKHAGSKAIQIVSAVLNAPLINMAQILEAEGVVEVDIPQDRDGQATEDEAGEVTEVGHVDIEEEDVHDATVYHEALETNDETGSHEAEEDPIARFLAQPEIHEDDISSDEDSMLQTFDNLRSPPRLSDLPVRQRSPATSNSSITGRRLFTPTSSTAEYFRQNRRTSSNVHRNVGRHESLQSTPRSASQPQPTFVFGSSPTAQPSSAFLFQSFGEASQHPTIEDEEEYLRLVSNVISAANTATLPSKGAYDMSGLFGALPEVDEEEIELSRRFRSHGLPERDMRIGALGELYVFELLRNMDPPLPRFSRDNWQSQMRKFVTIHPDYSDMLPWTAQETADIVYFDRKRVLTNHLVDKGYLDKTAWQNKKPLFLIEVKSTTGHSRTPFYMSKRQYQRRLTNTIINLINNPKGLLTTFTMSRRLSILKGDDLVPADSIHPETPSLTKTNPLMRQVVTPPSLSSSQSEDTDMDSYYSSLPIGLKPSVIPPRDDVPPGHVRLLGGFICPADPAEFKEDDDTEASFYHCPADILEPKDTGEFPGEKTQGDGKPEVTSPKAPQPPMLYLRGISTPPVPAGPTSSPFQGYNTLYQGINPPLPQSVGHEHLQPVDPLTRLRMTPHHAMNPPSPDFVQPITPYHPKPIVPGLPEPIGPHPAQPIVYYHAEPIDPRAQAPLTPYNSQAVAIYHPQRISSLDGMLSPSPNEAPTPTPPHRCSITTFNPEASEFTPSPTGPGMDNPEATDFALSPTGSGMITYEASEFTHNPTDLGMIPHEEAGVEGFGGLDANSQAPMVETVQDTYSQILAIEDERDREDAINDFYYQQARPWTDEDTRREKEEQELEERKRRFGRKK
ncbi:Histidine kinase/HSP90-like ATPase superfamily [Fusarium oxysporum f. sp. vasinfectum]|nr:Histidine kinase/HSP90-like ATPase superfamily [Fusarium oxysporum f. sp. vasinfectum]